MVEFGLGFGVEMPVFNEIPKGATIAVGMSGGVDSTIVALLLVERGFSVIGLTMKIWDGSFMAANVGRPGCFGPGETEDLAAAEAAARRIGIPHHVVDLVDCYKHNVLDYFRSEYMAGRTPNPCARCNRSVKFGSLLEKARGDGIEFDYFATGHYARTQYNPITKRHSLLRGVDYGKDQSYFLSRLEQDQLARLVLPLGEMTKGEVKDRARQLGWSALAEKQESQDFIEGGDYGGLFEAGDYRPGPIIDGLGNVLGEHNGIVHYTVGQRRGLRIGGFKDPLYVVRIDAAANTVHVGTESELFSSLLKAENLNWIALDTVPKTPRLVEVKIRLRHRAAVALMTKEKDTERVTIYFECPQSAVTPGQIAVFYDGDDVMGSGIIA